jgi:hypothetical protein
VTASHRDYISYDKVAVTRHRKKDEIVPLLDNRYSKSAWDSFFFFFDNSQIFILKCLNILFRARNSGNIVIISRQMGLKEMV